MDNIEKHLNELFDQARNTPPQTTSDQIFGTFLTSLGKGSTGLFAQLFNLKHLIIMFSSSAFIFIAAFWGLPGVSGSDLQSEMTQAKVEWNEPVKEIQVSNVVAENPSQENAATPVFTELEDREEETVESEVIITTEVRQTSPTGDTTDGPEVKEPAFPFDVNFEEPILPELEAAIQPDTTKDDEEEDEEEEELTGTTITHVITTNSTFEELEKIAQDAHQAGLMMRYDLKFKRDKIKKMTLYLRYAGGTNSYCGSHHIHASGTFIRNIGWLEDENGKAIKILK